MSPPPGVRAFRLGQCALCGQTQVVDEINRLCKTCERDSDFREAAESDPHGIDQHAPGAKLDAGKVRAEQLLGAFARALTAVAEVGEYGANKYTLGGWESVPDGVNRYANARMRHMLWRCRGEERDPDTGLLHLAHEAWNVLAQLELKLREDKP